MHIARKLLIATALLSWPWIASAPPSAASPAPATAGPGLRAAPEAAPGLLRLVSDHDHDGDRDQHHRHHSRHRHHHRHGGDHDRGDHDHGDHGD